MLKKFILCLPLAITGCVGPAIVGGIGTVGLSAVEDRGIEGVASDQVLRVKINYALHDNLNNFSDYELTIYKGRVLVTGIANDTTMKAKALSLVKGVQGVQEVIDGINIKDQDGLSEYARDGWMTTKLKATLYADEDIYAPNYVIRTFDKVIYIFGTAQTAVERDTVIEYASDITGVRRVVNFIQLVK